MTKPALESFEVFLVIDSGGDYAIGVDYETALEAYDNDIGGGAARRIVKLVVRATLPEEAEQLSVDVPATAGTTLHPTEAAAE